MRSSAWPTADEATCAESTRPGTTVRAAHRAAWIAAALATLLYLPGITRAFDYDEAITVKWFVRSPSLLDPFRRQVVYNNHVAFSFLEHVVSTVTGHGGEWVMRLLPLAAAVACLGLIVSAVARHLGLGTALLAGGLLATNPMFLDAARDVRGYSLLAACATASTLLLLDLELRETRARSLGYSLIAALGIATHLYMLLAILGQIVFLAARRRISPAWRTRWLLAFLLGGAAYLGVVHVMIASTHGRDFRPAFPADLAYQLLSASPVASVLAGAGVAITVWSQRRRPESALLAAAATCVIAGLWIGAPTDLYPRFFVWATPAIAVAAAYGLTRIPRGALVGAIACALALAPQLTHYTDDHIANRAGAQHALALRQPGEPVCAFLGPAEAIPVYLDDFTVVMRAQQLRSCGIVIALDRTARPDLLAATREQFANSRRLPATTDGYLFWR